MTDNISARDNLVSIEGEIEDIIYQNSENGYTVCEIDYQSQPLVLVGIMPFISVGESVKVLGEWANHPVYGRQFKVDYFEKAVPADENAMLRYLSSRSLRGIGPKLASRIVNEFKSETFEVIENSPELLSHIKGITLKKAQEISEEFKKQFGVRNIMMFFSAFYGVNTSVRIYKKWGSAAIDIVKENPYILCEEIYGIGFDRADLMAERLGIAKDSEKRIKAGIKYILKYNASTNGHVYLPQNKLSEAAEKLLDITSEKALEAIENLCREAQLIKQEADEHVCIYLPELYFCESFIANKLIGLSEINLYGSIDDSDSLIAKTEMVEGIKYVSLQLEAIKSAINKSVTILTGGPGTGKTTIIKAIINIFSLVGMKCALAAPTGRAAKRMSEATCCEAKTIHRLLEIEYSSDETLKFNRNENNPLDCDAVIIDEMSMVDVYLFNALLKAVRPGTRFVFIGDCDQLPSVGAGDVLGDIIRSGRFPVCRLNEIFRQKGGSDIIENAHRINRGEYPKASGKDGDFFFIGCHNSFETVKTVVDLCKNRLPRTYGSNVLDGIQVISCTRKGEAGTVNLNLLLQKAINPPSTKLTEKKFRDVIFRVNDKVMQIRNNYDLEWEKADGDSTQRGFGIFNGDIGVIVDIDLEEEYLTVDFDTRLARYTFDILDELEHAYAVTVHKSQGSQYPIVIMPVFNPAPMLATRNLLYTAITRAQKMVILVGSYDSICRMVDNNRHSIRYTGLERMLLKY